ncbi:glycoside hydrolase family 97 protein [Candidatus Saccharibacteria bacterium]|nr:glycoside hydrolase family 97 protein [Candidatus Saccharibacteria bacterium]
MGLFGLEKLRFGHSQNGGGNGAGKILNVKKNIKNSGLSSVFAKKPRREAVFEIKSPNGRLVATFMLDKGQICYFVKKDEQVIVRRSKLGIAVKDDRPMTDDFGLIRAYSKSIDETWEAYWGEQRVIRNHYNETAIYLEETGKPNRLLTLRFRVFDDGVAFRYEVPVQNAMDKMIVADELTEFTVDVNGQSWSIPAYQPDRYEYDYTNKRVHELHESVHTPLTIQCPTGHYISLHEAALYNYGSMTLKLDGASLRSDITPLADGMRAYVELPFSTPWRVIMVGNSAVDLVVNRMLLNLNEPPRDDFSWVSPTKFLGIWWAMYVGEWTWAPGERHGATTEHAKQYIDACAKLGIPALLIEGWNDGWEGDWLENGRYNKFTEATPDFDMRAVANYARENGVEIVGHHETVGFIDNYEEQIEDAYAFLRERGVRYIKSGYAGSKMMINGQREFHHSQLGVLHYQYALELAAEYQIMLDVHEPIKGTGIERTWPNLMTREGARGQEYEGGALVPSHACFLPFTRLLAGGMDYTSGIFDVGNFSKRIASTIVRQLAYYVTIYSSMQMAADRPQLYLENFPDLFAFIRDVPVRWEKTVPLLGEIGRSFVVARQAWQGDEWYVGGVTNEEGRKVELYLDFIEPRMDYVATIYRDSEDAHYRDHQLGYVIEERIVRRGDRIELYMAPGGGFAIKLKKEKT